MPPRSPPRRDDRPVTTLPGSCRLRGAPQVDFPSYGRLLHSACGIPQSRHGPNLDNRIGSRQLGVEMEKDLVLEKLSASLSALEARVERIERELYIDDREGYLRNLFAAVHEGIPGKDAEYDEELIRSILDGEAGS